jgi:hypothetical protein
MKMDMMSGIKPKDSDSYDGAVTQEDLDCMLEHLIAAEKIKSDSVLYQKVKDYAASKNKMIDSMLENESVDYEEKEEESEEESEDSEEKPKKGSMTIVMAIGKKKPESFDDLKKIRKAKEMEE